MPAPRVAFAIVDFPPNTLTYISVINTPPTGPHALQTVEECKEICPKKAVFCAAGISCLFIHQHLWFELQNQIHLVRALAGAALSYCNLPQPVGAQRVRGFRFEHIRAREANGLVTCFLNQLLRPGIRFASSGLRWLFTCK
jgi:hypothetical protein